MCYAAMSPEYLEVACKRLAVFWEAKTKGKKRKERE